MRHDLFANILDGRRLRSKATNHIRVFADQSEQQVSRLDGHTLELARLMAGEENDSSRCFRVPFKHYRILSLSCSERRRSLQGATNLDSSSSIRRFAASPKTKFCYEHCRWPSM